MSVVDDPRAHEARSPRANVVALQDIDLAIEPGEFVSLIGPSGLRQVDAAARSSAT